MLIWIYGDRSKSWHNVQRVSGQPVRSGRARRPGRPPGRENLRGDGLADRAGPASRASGRPGQALADLARVTHLVHWATF
eukprot:gene9599-biopygen18227